MYALRLASPASIGGRGLKRSVRSHPASPLARIARQYWRAWIETTVTSQRQRPPRRIARQYWRAWIETPCPCLARRAFAASPASIGGRGLKQHVFERNAYGQVASPASIGGRGLKLLRAGGGLLRLRSIARQYWRAWIETSTPINLRLKSSWHRPPVLAGVD